MKNHILGFLAAALFVASAGVSQAMAYSAKDVPAFNLVSVMVTPDSMHWALPENLSCTCLLSVAGDNGVQSNMQFNTEDSLYIGSQDANGQQLPDGDYQYQLISMTETFLNEMRAALITENGAKLQELQADLLKRSAQKTGSFTIVGGQFDQGQKGAINPDFASSSPTANTQ